MITPFEPIQALPKTLAGMNSAAAAPAKPFGNYMAQAFNGVNQGVYDYFQGYYKLAAGQVDNMHNLTVTAYQGAMLAKLAGVVTSLGIKAISTFMQINI